ncbi:MAG: hypothetical protein IJV36_01760 [Prevotella sp.]|nr:hypothetical protein [Prevotella sp.]
METFSVSFTGMPKLERIHFTDNVWNIDNATFAKDIDVHVARLSYNDKFWGICNTDKFLTAWSSHRQVKHVYCDDESTYSPFRYGVHTQG